MARIDPELLRRLLADPTLREDGLQYFPVGGGGNYTEGGFTPDQTPSGGGSISKTIGGGMLENYDTQGNFTGTSKDYNGMSPAMYAALFAAPFALGQLGMFGGAGGGLTESALASALEAGGSTLPGVGGLSPGLLSGGGGLSSLGGLQAMSNPASAVPAEVTAALNSPEATGELLSAQQARSLIPSELSGGGLLEAIGGGRTLAGLAGGLLGAAAGRDQTQSATRAPWEPAQGLLKDVISGSQDLYKQQTAQPFSDTQKGAYNNQFSLLNAINQMAPAMFQGMNANASGQNAYDRNNPRRALTGSNTQLSFNPMSLLAQFGGK